MISYKDTICGNKEYRKRMLTGRDIITGKSMYNINKEERIKNLEKVSKS